MSVNGQSAIKSFLQDPIFDSCLLKEISEFGVELEVYSVITSTEILKAEKQICRVANSILLSSIPPSVEDDVTKKHYISAARRHHLNAAREIASFSTPETYNSGWVMCAIGPEQLDVLEYLATHPEGISALNSGVIDLENAAGQKENIQTLEMVDFPPIFKAAYKANRLFCFEKILREACSTRKQFKDFRDRFQRTMYCVLPFTREEQTCLRRLLREVQPPEESRKCEIS